MALSNAEKQKRFRDRQRAKREANLMQPEDGEASNLFKAPFFGAFQANGNMSDFELAWDIMGLEAPEFVDDTGPQSLHGIVEQSSDDRPFFAPDGGSLARAEVMVGCLLDAASTLAGIINVYKKQELNSRIKDIEAEIERAPKTAVSRMPELMEIRTCLMELEKGKRWPLPAWKIEPP